AGSTLDNGTKGFAPPGIVAAGTFTRIVTASGFAHTSLRFRGDFAGKFLAPTLGTAAAPVTTIEIDGNMRANSVVAVNYLGTLDVRGDMAGTVDAFGDAAAGSGRVLLGPGITSHTATGSGTAGHTAIGTILVKGNLPATGSATAPSIITASVTGVVA